MRVLSDFTGHWALSRRIVPVTGAEARFEGMAEWTPEGAYQERGVLSVQGQPPMQAERRYRWDADLSVYFEDGRFFHKVPPLGGETGHWCDPDQYDVVYDFGKWPRWQVSWQVFGPRKNYEMISDYSRG